MFDRPEEIRRQSDTEKGAAPGVRAPVAYPQAALSIVARVLR
jgi:hypothetical protein